MLIKVDAMASRNKGGTGNGNYTSKKKYKYVHYISYITGKCLKFHLHDNE